MVCEPCGDNEHERCIDKVNPQTGEPRNPDYRGCDCAHAPRK